MKRLSMYSGLSFGNRKRGFWVAIYFGGVTVRIGETIWGFRPPWNRPLWSERNGANVKHYIRFQGWRLFVRRPA